MKRGTAQERIEFGAPVLCRDFRVSSAPAEIANGTARHPPKWDNRNYYERGDFVVVDPIDGLGERCLQAIANGPIMDPIRLHLPAGKLSEPEYQARLDLQFKEAGIER